MSSTKTQRQGRWYFGGIASAGAACCTHPLDLIKVTLQTQQGKLSVLQLTVKVVREQGKSNSTNVLHRIKNLQKDIIKIYI